MIDAISVAITVYLIGIVAILVSGGEVRRRGELVFGLERWGLLIGFALIWPIGLLGLIPNRYVQISIE